MTHARALQGLLVAAVALGTAASREARATQSEARCYTVWVAPETGRDERPRPRRLLTFSASEILDLRFLVLLPARRGVENVALKVYTPKGHLYQELHIPVGADGPPRPRARFQWATAHLPVAGTTIVTSSLYGRWTAEAYLDGAATPCGRARSFTLEP